MIKAFGSKGKEVSRSKYEVDGIPPLSEAIPLGLQHIFAMFASNIAVPMIVAGIAGIQGADLTIMVQCAMFIAGIATLNQCYPIGRVGGKLPVVMGTSFGFLPTNIAIAKGYGISGLLGATFVGGLFGTVLGFFLKPLRRFFPSLVTGTVVLTIGLSLLPTGITSMAGGNGSPTFGSPKNWIVGLIVLFVVLGLNQFTKGFTKTSSILLGIIVGYIIAIPLGMVNLAPVKAASWFSLPKPFHFPMEFKWGAIAPMMVMFIVTTVETVGDVSAITMGGAGREATDKELSGSIINNGLSSSFAAIFNGLPTTSFSQNVGMIAFTKIMSRFVVAVGAIFLIVAGLIPKLGALVSTIPPSVIGGASLVIFSQITLTGINMLTSTPLTDRDKVIIGLSLAFGIGLTQVPAAMEHFPEFVKLIFGGSGIVIACLVAMILNIAIPQQEEAIENVKEGIAKEA
ncbi:nucleobase:cation symporter-2, NCS2 family [Proteiniborus ethanoligenes]|uniref:Nucleobase:cation symporter-2, NCS2 family n=1 Tax=Proteiniborus ethanoligenes TaxID=415015 RepID=A0A1H3MBN7_9FIRM|nr:nucleobase:cation symporter-2 family protein [Proteiniborus ethanoligenes]SDY74132.1 nucleobase:cation symporter-2, NCS2 family [Proteiniborus ethanoligenes]